MTTTMAPTGASGLEAICSAAVTTLANYLPRLDDSSRTPLLIRLGAVVDLSEYRTGEKAESTKAPKRTKRADPMLDTRTHAEMWLAGEPTEKLNATERRLNERGGSYRSIVVRFADGFEVRTGNFIADDERAKAAAVRFARGRAMERRFAADEAAADEAFRTEAARLWDAAHATSYDEIRESHEAYAALPRPERVHPFVWAKLSNGDAVKTRACEVAEIVSVEIIDHPTRPFDPTPEPTDRWEDEGGACGPSEGDDAEPSEAAPAADHVADNVVPFPRAVVRPADATTEGDETMTSETRKRRPRPPCVTGKARFAGFDISGPIHGDDISVNARTVAKMLQSGTVRAWCNGRYTDDYAGDAADDFGRREVDPASLVERCQGRDRDRRITYRNDEHRIVLSPYQSLSFVLLETADPYLLAVESLSRGELMALCERLQIQGRPHIPSVVRKLRERDRARATDAHAA